MLNEKNYIAIADWMVQDFDLNTKELLTYAIIYGFSQDGESGFSGSLSYLASWLNIQRNHVLRYLNSLLEKQMIIKEEKFSGSKKWCEYRVVMSKGATKDSSHIIIYPWMIEDLNLQDKELLLYALIHGFSLKGSYSYFTGNNSYISKWLKVDKQHVSRYTSSLIKKNLLERTEDERQIKYRVLFPDNKQDDSNSTPNHFGNTLTNDDTSGANHFGNTPNQIGNRGITNLGTNKLINKLDNKLINNNIDNNSNLANNLTLEDFFVVVNEEVDKDELNSEEEKMFNKKLLSDKKLYEKYKDSKIDIARIMKVYARNRLVNMTYVYKDEISEKGRDVTNLAEALLFKTLNLKKYNNKIDVINNLDNEQIFDLYKTACSLYTSNEEEKTYIRKTPEAYFVGVVDKVLEM